MAGSGRSLRRLGRVPTAVQLGDLLLDVDAGTVTRAGAVLEQRDRARLVRL